MRPVYARFLRSTSARLGGQSADAGSRGIRQRCQQFAIVAACAIALLAALSAVLSAGRRALLHSIASAVPSIQRLAPDDEAHELVVPISVDAVFTYVDGTDPVWRASFDAHAHSGNASSIANRYREWGELKYAMRSVAMHAPWVQRIFLVVASSSQVPSWLDVQHARIRVVYHNDLFDDAATQLPTFNSLAIESVLHRIPDLSQHFLYMNNDVFFGRAAKLSDFATRHTYTRYLDWALDSSVHSPCFLLQNRRVRQSDALAPLRPGCQTIQFYRDRLLALQTWGVFLSYWFAHTPHLWQRAVLYEVERRLAPHYRHMRTANRVRDESTDVSVHSHFEAAMEHRWNMRGHKERRVTSVHVNDAAVDAVAGGRAAVRPAGGRDSRDHSSSGAPLYLYRTFADADLRDARWYAKLDCELRARPLFFGVDDDLKISDTAAMVMHRRRLEAIFSRHWPVRAEWERRDDDNARQPPLNEAAYECAH